MTIEQLNTISMRVNGCIFEKAPVEWQRMIEDMIKRGIKIEVLE